MNPRHPFEQMWKKSQPPPPPPALVVLGAPTITVGELATQIQVRSSEVLKHLMLDLGIMATVTQSIDAQTAGMVAYNFGVEVRDACFSSFETPGFVVSHPPVVQRCAVRDAICYAFGTASSH